MVKLLHRAWRDDDAQDIAEICRVWAGGAIASIILIGSLGWLSGPEPSGQNVQPSSASTTETKTKKQSAAENKRFEQCRAKLKKAQKLDLLYDLKIDPLPRVVVGPTFYTVPLDAKQGFADTANCFLMTGEDKYINFDLLDYRTASCLSETYADRSVREELPTIQELWRGGSDRTPSAVTSAANPL